MARLSLVSVSAILAFVPQVYSSGCNADNVLRALRRYSTEAVPFCGTFIQQTQTTTVTPTSHLVNTFYVTKTVTASTETDVSLATKISTSTEIRYFTEIDTALLTQVQPYTQTVPTRTVTSITSNSYADGAGIVPLNKRATASTSLPSYVSQYPASRVSSACSCLDGVATATVTDTATASLKTLTTSVAATSEIDVTVTVTQTSTVTIGAVQTLDSTVDVTVTSTLSSSTFATLVLATQTVVCGACVAGNQVVQNPSFEQVDGIGKPLIWTTYAQQYTTISDQTTSYAANGNHLILATETDTTPAYPRVILAQFLNLCPTATYTLSFYVGIYNPNGGSVTSQVEVQLDGTTVYGKVAPCSSGNCIRKSGSSYYWRLVTVSGISARICNPELVFRVYFTKTSLAVAKVPGAVIDLVKFIQE